MSEKEWKRASCGCIVYMDDTPSDPEQLVSFRFDESNCRFKPPNSMTTVTETTG